MLAHTHKTYSSSFGETFFTAKKVEEIEIELKEEENFEDNQRKNETMVRSFNDVCVKKEILFRARQYKAQNESSATQNFDFIFFYTFFFSNFSVFFMKLVYLIR